MSKKVLVTGATGAIGTIVAEDLAGEYDFTFLSRREIPRPGFRRLDVAEDYAALEELVREQEAVLHLAYVEEDETTCTNVKMAKNIYRAALAAEPHPRVIMASSIHAVGGHIDWDAEPYVFIARREYDRIVAMPEMITAAHRPHPNGLYGALKCYVELLGEHYSSLGLEVIAIRFGGVRADDSLPDEPGCRAFWLSRRDCVQIIEKAINAELEDRFCLVFAVSNNKYRVHDISTARKTLGYEPQDDAESRFPAAHP